MNLNYTPDALADLEDLHAYIAEDNIAAADRVLARLLQSISHLENFPLIGRVGRVDGTRELVIPNSRYVAIYRIADETEISILRIMHTSREWPSRGA